MSTTDAEELEARVANRKGYNALILACDDDVRFDLIDQAKTTRHPKGDACEAWINLKTKFEPEDGLSMIELKEDFVNKNL